MHHTETLLLFSTFPSQENAEEIAQLLIEKKLAACVNVLPSVRSFYSWEGKIEQESETLCLIKTTTTRYAALETFLQEHHPYDTPEIIATPITQGSQKYLEWLQGIG